MAILSSSIVDTKDTRNVRRPSAPQCSRNSPHAQAASRPPEMHPYRGGQAQPSQAAPVEMPDSQQGSRKKRGKSIGSPRFRDGWTKISIAIKICFISWPSMDVDFTQLLSAPSPTPHHLYSPPKGKQHKAIASLNSRIHVYTNKYIKKKYKKPLCFSSLISCIWLTEHFSTF